MLSVLRSASPVPQQQSLNEHSRIKFSNILGFGTLHKDLTAASSQHSVSATNGQVAHSLTRQSVDVVPRHITLKKNRRDRSSVAEVSFADKHSALAPTCSNPTPTAQSPRMTTRRVPIRVDGQDGPWTVSVAETPHDVSSYSLYIRSQCFCVPSCLCSMLPTACYARGGAPSGVSVAVTAVT